MSVAVALAGAAVLAGLVWLADFPARRRYRAELEALEREDRALMTERAKRNTGGTDDAS